MDWKMWCRLCANNICSNGILLKSVDSILRTKLTNKFLTDENLPETICDDCSESIQRLSRFSDTIMRAENMFVEIIRSSVSDQDELKNLRIMYGFDDGFVSVDVKPMIKLETEDDIALAKTEPKEISDRHSKKTRLNKLFFKVNCHLCPQEFTSFIQLSSHCKADHNSRPKLTCICGSTLSSLSALSRHREMHQLNIYDDKLACKLCSEKFTRRMLLDDHIVQVHGLPSELPFACSAANCSKKFPTQLKLRQHEKTHTKGTPDELGVQCERCEKRFPSKARLSGHYLTAHVAERNFICDQCGNGFKTKGALTDHQNSHKNELVFKCDKCPKAFKHLRGIKRHKDRHNRTEKFICAICQASLSSKDVLQCHMLIHSDEKRFKCHLCSNAYKRTKNLKIHIMSVHTGGNPQYQCPWCDRTFYDGSNCYKHRKNSHPVEFAASQGQEVKKTYLPKLEHLQPQ